MKALARIGLDPITVRAFFSQRNAYPLPQAPSANPKYLAWKQRNRAENKARGLTADGEVRKRKVAA